MQFDNPHDALRHHVTGAIERGEAEAIVGLNIEVDDRGVEYVEHANLAMLPSGWALCGTCGRAWNDEKSTGVTPAPSGRCPFEYEHEDDDDESTSRYVEPVRKIEIRGVTIEASIARSDGSIVVQIDTPTEGDEHETMRVYMNEATVAAWKSAV